MTTKTAITKGCTVYKVLNPDHHQYGEPFTVRMMRTNTASWRTERANVFLSGESRAYWGDLLHADDLTVHQIAAFARARVKRTDALAAERAEQARASAHEEAFLAAHRHLLDAPPTIGPLTTVQRYGEWDIGSEVTEWMQAGSGFDTVLRQRSDWYGVTVRRQWGGRGKPDTYGVSMAGRTYHPALAAVIRDALTVALDLIPTLPEPTT